MLLIHNHLVVSEVACEESIISKAKCSVICPPKAGYGRITLCESVREDLRVSTLRVEPSARFSNKPGRCTAKFSVAALTRRQKRKRLSPTLKQGLDRWFVPVQRPKESPENAR